MLLKTFTAEQRAWFAISNEKKSISGVLEYLTCRRKEAAQMYLSSFEFMLSFLNDMNLARVLVVKT
jgi:hypothetical protein